MRGHRSYWLGGFLKRAEHYLIRVLILSSVALVIMQIGIAQNPVDAYLAVASRVEYPPLEVSSDTSGLASTSADTNLVTANQNQTWQIVLKAQPAVPVLIVQDNQIIGTLSKGEQEITVHSGQVLLDASNINQKIQVQITNIDKNLKLPKLNQTYLLNSNIVSISVTP